MVTTAERFGPTSDLGTAEVAAVLADGPTAVVVETPETGLALADGCAALGVDVPGELSTVVLDHVAGPIAGWSHLDVPRREMGGRSVDVLLDLLEDRVQPDHCEVVACGPFGLETVTDPRPGVAARHAQTFLTA